MTTAQDSTDPLAGMEVIEIGGGFAAAYCGKQFSDFGATVYRIEPTGGIPERQRAPLLSIGGGRHANPFQAWLDTGKQSLCLDPAVPADMLRWQQLRQRACLVVDSRAIEPHGLQGLDLADAQAIHLRLTWFGDTGPRAGHHGSDFVSRAVAGHVKMTGPPDGPPVVVDAPMGQLIAGMTAFTGAMAALLSKAPPRRIDLAVSEATVVLSEYLVAQCVGEGMPEVRSGINRFPPNFPLGVYQCSDGFVGVSVVTPAQWQSLCRILDCPELAEEAGLRLNTDRMSQADRLDRTFTPLFLRRSAQEWFDLGRANQLPVAIVPDMATLLGQAVHRERGSFGRVSVGGAQFAAPIVPLALTATPPRSDGRAPMPGQGTVLTSPARELPAERGSRLPLEGVRILDLTMGWAGPLATRQLADLGADIVKIESCRYPDWWRGVSFTEESIAAKLHERTARYNLQNRNKRVVNLDLTQPEGLAVFMRLLPSADAVLDNYSSGVMRKMGLDYDSLRAVNPRVVALSMPAFGTRSAWSDLRAYGSTFEHACGLPTVLGNEADLPTMSHQALGDPVGGLSAAAALLVALHARRRTGSGQFIDLAQVQCLLPLLAPWIVHQSAFGSLRRGERVSAQSHWFSRCYRCTGQDAWLALSIETPAQWQAACALLDLPAGGHETPEATSCVDSALSAWTGSRSLEEAVAQLQGAGVPAAPVLYPSELVRDPHLQARGFWQTCDRPYFGRHLQASLPLLLDGAYPAVRRPAPLFGEHNEAILLGEVGLAAAELRALEASGIVGRRPLPSRVTPTGAPGRATATPTH